MRILIVDDEAPARERLGRLVKEIDGNEVVGEAGDGHQALEVCARLDPEVLLLDVRMPGLSGLEVARHLGALAAPPAIIFTTAYDEYALAAFEAHAVGYLLKPVRREKLARALRHAGRVSRPGLQRLAATESLEGRRRHICVRLGDQLRLVPIEEVYYFVADQKYTTMHHAQGQDLIDEPLKDLAEEFASLFIRIHRNALIAERHVAAVEKLGEGQYGVRMRERSEVLRVSRRHGADLLRRLRRE